MKVYKFTHKICVNIYYFIEIGNTFKLLMLGKGMDNYLQLVQKIADLAKISKEEIERKVEAKRAKLSGLVSKEGAAQIVAAELGINFDRERMKISELVNGMKRANILGKVIQISPVREFTKNGRSGKVVNMLVADDSSNIRTVLWDTNHIGLIESEKIKIGDTVEISNGGIRNGELHLGSFSDIRKSNEELGEVVLKKAFFLKKLKDVKTGETIKTRALIVQTFEPRYFEVCPECRKKAIDGECAIHGKVKAERRALINFVLDDGTETIRAVLFGESIKKLGLNDEEIFSLEKFAEKKEDLLGEEKMFSGNVRSNSLYNINEFNVENVEDISPDELIKELKAG